MTTSTITYTAASANNSEDSYTKFTDADLKLKRNLIITATNHSTSTSTDTDFASETTITPYYGVYTKKQTNNDNDNNDSNNNDNDNNDSNNDNNDSNNDDTQILAKLCFNTDTEAAFVDAEGNDVTLSVSNTYGNLNVLNKNTLYITSSQVAGGDYVSSNFTTIDQLDGKMNAHYSTTVTSLNGITTITTEDTLVSKKNIYSDGFYERVGTSEPAQYIKIQNAPNLLDSDNTWTGNNTFQGDVIVTNICQATATTTSDARIKQNIKPLHPEQSRNLIENTNVYSFNFKEGDVNRLHYGVIAQELQQIAPELVYEAKDEQRTLSVSYIEMIPHLINVIKQQQNQIDELKMLVDNLSKNKSN